MIAGTWVTVLSSTIYFWVLRGIEPPWINWIILAIISFIPFAEKLKIGDFIEISKKVSGLQKEIDQINQSIANLQIQQMINVSIQGEKEAAAFADSILSRVKDYTNLTDSKPAELGKADLKLNVTTSDDDARTLFITVCDELTLRLTPLMQILYYARTWKMKKTKPAWSDILVVSLLDLVKELKKDSDSLFSNIPNFDSKIITDTSRH